MANELTGSTGPFPWVSRAERVWCFGRCDFESVPFLLGKYTFKIEHQLKLGSIVCGKTQEMLHND